MAQAMDLSLEGIQPVKPLIDISEEPALQDAPEQSSRQPNALSLPQGKEYHVFFSYSSEDLTEVEQMIKTLEKAPYNIKCCFDKRDFLAGKTIMANINHFIAASVKTVVVLSPNFTESRYCELEMTLAQTMSLAEKQNAVVPVVLRNCPIPDSLKILNYINAEEEDVCAKIARTLQKDQQEQLNPFKIWTPPVEYLNGSFLLIPGVKGSAVGKPLLGCQFQPLTAAQKRDLKNMGIKITESEFEKVIQIVNEINLVRYQYRSCCSSFLFFWAKFLPIFGIVFVIFYLCHGDVSDQGMSKVMGTLSMVLILVASVVLSAFMYLAFLLLSYKGLKLGIASINNTYYKKNFCVMVSYRKKFWTVYLQRKLRQIRMGNEMQNISEEIEKQIADDCESLIKKHVMYYIDELLQNKFEVGGSRHRMQGNWPCLCQYVESKHREDNMQLLGCVNEPTGGARHQRFAAENPGNNEDADDVEPLLP